MIILNVCAVFANSLKLIKIYEVILFGRLLAGIFASSANICYSEIMNKIIPTKFIQIYAMTINSGICFGIFLSNFIAAIVLPSEDAIASDLEEDNNWRIVFVSPIIIQVVVVILIYFLYNFYTPQECI